MSVSSVPVATRLLLWGKAGGRCEYEGCNSPLYCDQLTKSEFNTAYIAHIVADQPDGPRGDPNLSKQLKQDLSNLMVLCDVHHRLVDIGNVAGHSVERLRGMKERHERRIELLTSLQDDKQSHVLLYGSKVGQHDTPLHFDEAASAMVPDRFPAEPRAIELGLKNGSYKDNEPIFWEIEVGHLRRQFADRVKPRLGDEIINLSVFAFAPIPLLIELGRLLSDIPAADIYDRQREPPSWRWQAPPVGFDFQIVPPEHSQKDQRTVALVLSLSGNVVAERIHQVLGDGVAVWTITHPTPMPGFMRSREQLMKFRDTLRQAFDRIKSTHGEEANLHVFPAVPISAAIDVGRVWMPKADLPFKVYDQNRATNGFVHVHTIAQ